MNNSVAKKPELEFGNINAWHGANYLKMQMQSFRWMNQN